MGKTSIQWTDETWNPTRGCVKVSPGCKHCYASTFAERWRGVKGHPYEQGFDPRLVPEKLAEPLRWKKPRRVFVNSMSDLFGEFVPDEYIAAVFGVMAAAPQHTFQILTKRAERLPQWCDWAHDFGALRSDTLRKLQYQARRLVPDFSWPTDVHANGIDWPLPNVWVGVSVESQKYADERIPHLLRTSAAVRFLSCEPLLGPVDISEWLPWSSSTPHGGGTLTYSRPRENAIAWVICGGESGAGARPMHLAWARSIIEQCRAAGTPCFVKQLGARPAMPAAEWHALSGPKPLLTPRSEDPIIKDAGLVQLALGDRLHGGNPAEWPTDLRVREWPEVRR